MIPALKRYGATVFGLVLLAGAIFVVQREFRSLSLEQVRTAMGAISHHALWQAGGLTVVAYLVLAGYDKLGSVYAGRPASWARSLMASFCGYALAHNLGFTAVSGAAVRLRFYSAWGYTAVQIAKVVGFTSLTFGLGGMALGGLVLVLEPEVLPWAGGHIPRWVLQLLALPLWAIVGAYVVLSRFFRVIRVFGHEVELPGLRMALAQTLLATVDVAVTAAIFYVLLPPAEGLTLIRFIGIYLAAYSLGIVASVPGGLGVFDSAILIGLAPYMGAAEVIGALLVFRLFYYIAPLFISGFLFAGFEISQRRHILTRFTQASRGAEALEAPAMATLVVLAGALMMFQGALPANGSYRLLLGTMELGVASQFAASVLGSLLVVLAYGLVRRLVLAWGLALVVLLAGGVLAWVRGEPWYGFLPQFAIAALLATMRGAFYRRTRVLAEPFSNQALLPMSAVVLCGLALAVVGHRLEMRDSAWWEIVFESWVPNGLRFTVGLAGLLLLIGLARLLRPAAIRPLPYDAASRTLLASWRGTVPPEADGVLLGEAGHAGVAFSRQKPIWVAHGDPAGELADRISVIWRFRDLCERNGVRPAFWDVGPEWQRIYADIGLTALPLPGREGRYVACHAEQDLDRLLARH
ncbi:lysylphosphatidylglycerol synthetase family protein [Rhodovarius crocodyli]|uniref:Lysylphosphatidylglycerol synthetase family protein n=1 Tax=Rhodovarius crocodyli TaxID=1979269 RepID=A0A437M1C8_9PROT|nr:phosphatidylglycerol lysyltransferase domain-containing protein [Rhodovarius crocodyli]RVT91501.1 lysylphosphatidylglycerol synthetase family protein [Rhodovarius crocodyli]